jgi:hypothetical protein
MVMGIKPVIHSNRQRLTAHVDPGLKVDPVPWDAPDPP